MAKTETSPDDSLYIHMGLAAANEANREFDVWKRVERAVANFDDSSPEGISPDQVHESFIAKVALASPFIGRQSKAEMTDQGLQLSIDPAEH